MSNPMFDQFTKMMADGMQLTQGVRDEMEAAFKDQAEKFFASMNVANTEEIEILTARVEALERRIASLENNNRSEAGGG